MAELRAGSGLLAWLAYPAVIGVSIAMHVALTGSGLPLQPSGYAAGALGAALVTLLELKTPHRLPWRGAIADVKTDLLYMLAVQIFVPLVLALSLSLQLLGALQGAGLEPAAFWPHDWPLAAQVVLMLLAADFLRYWLHVACHRYSPLWRLHAVHHSPPKLYWLNVGRFHPLEKALQYLLDALPFVLMGVGAEVLALYFVFYSVNGFFQHSNAELRFGPLNYLISSAELHRWHHSRVTAESNANYGNNLIVWDLLFGTRFLPRDREISDLGLPNRDYPLGFAEQLKTPLVRGIEHSRAAVPSWGEIGINLLIRARMTWIGLSQWPGFRSAAKRPARAQRECLAAILAANRDTRFGREHGFGEIDGYEAYRDRVPVQDYESLRPYIEEQERSGSPALTAEVPIFYAQTSGTTGSPKYVPILESSLRAHKRCQGLTAYAQFRAVPEAYYGKLLAIASPAIEGRLASGAPFGSASGHVYQNMPRVTRSKYVLPHEVFSIPDYELKYLAILRLAVTEPNLTYAAAANPSTFLKLLSTLRDRREELLRDVEAEDFARGEELPPEVLAAIRPRLRCTPARRAALREILGHPEPTLAELWPHLALLATWTGASCGIALAALRESLPERTRIAEVGYLASEVFGTVTVDLENQLGAPTLQQNFFEFVEVERWEREDPEFLTLDQLEAERDYYLLVTTAAGLYRYFMNDIVRVTGRFHATPTFRFVQKGKGVTNITGEKLYEGQVIEAVQAVEAELGFASPFFVMVADPQAARYRLLIECGAAGAPAASRIASGVEAELARRNVEYAQKRASGRLSPLEVCRLRSGAGDAYKKGCLARGQRESQFKVLALQYAEALDFAYEDQLVERG